MYVAEIDHFTQLLLMLVVSLLLGIAATALFRRTVPGLMTRLFKTEEAEQEYLVLLKDGYAVRERVRSLQYELEKLANNRSYFETDLRRIRRQVTNVANKVPDFIHEVGDPRPAQRKYVARLSVESSSPLLRSTSESYNPMWHHVNLIEVWASSRDEARQIADLSYSDKLGYQKIFVDSGRTQAEEAPQ